MEHPILKPLPSSSGDLLADRRHDYAEMLFASGDHAAAAELMLGALELAPRLGARLVPHGRDA